MIQMVTYHIGDREVLCPEAVYLYGKYGLFAELMIEEMITPAQEAALCENKLEVPSLPL
jgi:hypothetical protein